MFQTVQSLKCFDRDKVKAAVEKRFADADFCNAEKYKKELLGALDSETVKGMPKDLADRADRDNGKWRRFYTTYLKNRPLNQFAGEFARILGDETEDEELRVLMAEALAWFNLSANRGVIVETCDRLLEKGGMSEELTREVTRARTRLTSEK